MIQTRKLSNRKISKYKRKELGEAFQHVSDMMNKPTLTARDKEVLLAIYHHRCLTTEQIAEMLFKYDSKGRLNKQSNLIARRRLRKLFDFKLVDRFFIDVGENNGSSQAHVVLDTFGAKIVAGLLGVQVEELKWRYEMNQNLLPYHTHTVKTNNFYLYLLRKARICKHEITGYTTETHIRYDFTHNGKKVVLNPDAYGQYWIKDDGFHFFLEMDNGTMSPAVFQKKHDRYTAFYASEEYAKHYDSFPYILTVTTTKERAMQLRETIKRVDNTDVKWYFASEEDVRRDPLMWLSKDEENPLRII